MKKQSKPPVNEDSQGFLSYEGLHPDSSEDVWSLEVVTGDELWVDDHHFINLPDAMAYCAIDLELKHVNVCLKDFAKDIRAWSEKLAHAEGFRDE